MDAFCASVSKQDDPGLGGRPVIVGGSVEGRGVERRLSTRAILRGAAQVLQPTATRRSLAIRKRTFESVTSAVVATVVAEIGDFRCF